MSLLKFLKNAKRLYLKKWIKTQSLLFCCSAFAVNSNPFLYSATPIEKTIHTISINREYCSYQTALSIKVGKSKDGSCNYELETASYMYPSCVPLYLGGKLLEQKVGQGYDCAATHIFSPYSQQDKQIEYLLISDNEGHYVTASPSEGSVNLSEH